MQKVEGSNPFIRSICFLRRWVRRTLFRYRGEVAEGLRHGSAKPATPVRFRTSALSWVAVETIIHGRECISVHKVITAAGALSVFLLLALLCASLLDPSRATSK